MTKKLLFNYILILFGIASLQAQSSVQFYQTNLNKAIELAKKHDKLIFVDAYAPWCQPCKKMDLEFNERELANYFNNNFINVKVNMESKIGKEFSRYGIVFLPTFLILDKYGNIKIKIDRLLNAKELLGIAKQINGGDSFYASTPPPKNPVQRNTSASNNPTKRKVVPTTMKGVRKSSVTGATIRDEEPRTNSVIAKNDSSNARPGTTAKSSNLKSVEDKPDEKILYVLGSDSDNLPPEVLKQEAYFRMNLMDGSHFKTARDYLGTQSNWNTEENIKFIFDFLHHAGSKEFLFMMNNRAAFEAIHSKSKIRETIEILVYNKLYSGFPRPTLKEAEKLYGYLNPQNAKTKADAYFIERLYNEGKTKAFREKVKVYLDGPGKKDHSMMYRYAFSFTDKELINRKTLMKSIHMMELATRLNGQSYEYFDLLASLYYKQRKKQNALGAAQKAISLAKRYNKEYGATMILIEMIEDL